MKSDEQKTLILTRSAPAGRKLFLPSAEPDGDHEAVAVGEVLSTRSSRGGGCGRGPKARGDHKVVGVGEILSARSSRGGRCGRGPKQRKSQGSRGGRGPKTTEITRG